jgi:hypothetical protein
MKKSLIIILTTGIVWGAQAGSAEPWPAEPWTEAAVLTHLDTDFENNISGACYNPETDTFWVCRNGKPSAFWALNKTADGTWHIAVSETGRMKFVPPKGDLEGICQADYREDAVYLMVEGADKIRKYDTSAAGQITLLNEWEISEHVPTKGGKGSEGITFVPDEWLVKSGFTDARGNAYTSQGGMGGLMLIAHQNGGRIYAFDLCTETKEARFVAAYKTSWKESSGLEFDRSSGLLYIWHNTGPNYLEAARLCSYPDGDERRLSTVINMIGPKKGNLEGFAISPAGATDGICLIVDDDNQDGAALMLFSQFDFTELPGKSAAASSQQ